MAFRDLAEVLDPGLDLPINGTTYRIPPVDADTGLRLQRLAEHAARAAQATETGEPVDAELLGDADEVELYRSALGSAYEQMVAGGVSFAALKVAGITAWLFAAVGAEAAERYWNAAGDPEALAGNREATARSTRPPDSPNGTNRPKPNPAAIAGRPSSSTGR